MANIPVISGDSPSASSTTTGHEVLATTATRSQPRVKAKRQTIPVACSACQRRKSKCDGKRPTCSVCRRKTTTCTYDVEAGETRVSTLRKRNDALAFGVAAMSRVLNSMRERPIAEADEIFRQVRSAQDISSLLTNFGNQTLGTPDQHSSESSRSMRNPGFDLEHGPSPSPSIEYPSSPTSSKRNTHEMDQQRFTPCYIATQPFPDEDKLRLAVGAFFAVAGKLFHVFSHEQGMLLFDRVYRPPDDDRDKAAICELTALGALGCCYGHEGLPPGEGRLYYSFAQHHLEDSICADPTRGMRSCALIAMYNIMDRSTVALAYIELGLSMARRRGLHGKVRTLEMSRDDWIDCKRVWRTLTSLHIWLAASIGVVSDADKPMMEALRDLAIDDHPGFDEIIQTKMAEISVITANILRTVHGFERLSPHAARRMIDDLEWWYLQLPPDVRLPRLECGSDGLDIHATRGSALFVHLLYLGALLMLFRRTVAQANYTSHLSSGQCWVENKPATSRCLEKGIDAALQSARLLDVMRTRVGIFKHCWLVICQSYWSCAILLYAAARRSARFHFDSLVAGYTLEAEKCLVVLDYCGQTDFVARSYHTTLRTHYDKLVVLITDRRAQQAAYCRNAPPSIQLLEQMSSIRKEQEPSTQSCQSPTTISPLQPADIMLDIPQNDAHGKGLQTVAHDLQELLQRPHGREIVRSLRGSITQPTYSRSSDLFSSISMLPSIIDRSDWRFETCSAFNWSSPHLAPLNGRHVAHGTRSGVPSSRHFR